eukprot:COSAG02_NODE_15440_length_1171_cov_1.438433_1_plen_64_part_10
MAQTETRNIASPTDQVARDSDNLGRESGLNTTVELRSLAVEEEERARLEALERSRREAAEARAA